MTLWMVENLHSSANICKTPCCLNGYTQLSRRIFASVGDFQSNENLDEKVTIKFSGDSNSLLQKEQRILESMKHENLVGCRDLVCRDFTEYINHSPKLFIFLNFLNCCR